MLDHTVSIQESVVGMIWDGRVKSNQDTVPIWFADRQDPTCGHDESRMRATGVDNVDNHEGSGLAKWSHQTRLEHGSKFFGVLHHQAISGAF